MRIAIRSLTATLLWLLAATIGLLGSTFLAIPWLAYALLLAAGGVHFYLDWRAAKQRLFPRDVLVSLTNDTLDEHARQLAANCPLHPTLSLWMPRRDGELILFAADRPTSHRLAALVADPADEDHAVWHAFSQRKMYLQILNAPTARLRRSLQPLPASVCTWRLAVPVVHMVDRHRLAGVLCLEGDGAIENTHDLDRYQVSEHAVDLAALLRGVVSVLDRY